MFNHHHHGNRRNEEQNYGAYPYPGQNSGYYDGSSYPPAAQGPAYGYQPGYQQQPLGYGGYESAPPAPYGAVQSYGGGYGAPQAYPYSGAMQSYPQDGRMQEINTLRIDEQRHRTNEHRAEALGLGAAAFAAYEHHEVKVDPAHADRHRREERIAEATAVGAGGYALYEHQQSRHDHQQLQALGYDQYGNQPQRKHHHRHHGFLG